MASIVNSSTFYFPSKEEIINHLDKKFGTKDRYLSDKKIKETLAHIFEGKELCESSINVGVKTPLSVINRKIGLPDHVLGVLVFLSLRL